MKTPTNLAELIQYTAEQEQQRRAEKLAQAQLKLLTTSYDRAAAYTTVIVFSGYAGFFALWQLTKDDITRDQALWSALLLLVSLTAFVCFEVGKMIYVSVQVFRKARALESADNRQSLEKLIAVLDGMEQTYASNLKGFFAFWAVAVTVAVGGAISGAAVLVYAFITGLAK